MAVLPTPTTNTYTITFTTFAATVNSVTEAPNAFTVDLGQIINLNTAGGNLNAPIQFTAQTSFSNINVTMPITPNANSTNVYINGLLQSQSSFIINSNIITIPNTLNVVAGDLVSITY